MKRSVFISSTFSDLAQYRRAVWTLLERFKVTVLGMEEFGARKEAPLQTCLAEVEQADIYVGIIGFRLGSIHLETGKSFTQLEYERALDLGKEVLIYFMDETSARVPPNTVDRGNHAEKLEAFKAVLKDRHTIDFFVSEEDLAAKLKRDLTRVLGVDDSPAPEKSNEFASSAAILGRFSLVPKSVSGKQILLRIHRKDQPFPASKALCSAFNLEYGNTVGIPVQIVAPEGFDHIGLSQLYATGKRVDSFLSVVQEEQFEIYAAPLFYSEDVTETRARFKPETYVRVESIAAGLFPQNDFGIKQIHEKAEGKIALLFIGTAGSDNTDEPDEA